MVGVLALIAILGGCILLMYWGFKRVVMGLEIFLNQKRKK